MTLQKGMINLKMGLYLPEKRNKLFLINEQKEKRRNSKPDS